MREWFDNNKVGSEIYYLNGKQHREDGPAYVGWYDNGMIESEYFHINGNLHRENGPSAIEWSMTGRKIRQAYYFNGVEIKSEWFAQLGKDIIKDFTNEVTRNMILNIQGGV